MPRTKRILVVSPNVALASTLLAWLGEDHHDLTVVTTFAAAKHHLAMKPDLLITDLKLGEFNGLHLALRGKAAGTAAIVLGENDPVFEEQATQLGAAYLSAADLELDELVAVIGRLLTGARDSARAGQHWFDSPVAVTNRSAHDPAKAESVLHRIF
jgi:DNA-binding response OmpR family regulator